MNDEPLRVIPIIIGKNCTILTKSREFLDELDIKMESVYEEIGNLLGVYKANCTTIMYKKKVIRIDEINDRTQLSTERRNKSILNKLERNQGRSPNGTYYVKQQTQTQILCSQNIAVNVEYAIYFTITLFKNTLQLITF
ncbi:Hypothetical_protein [Hexamita inflata]|uniref:Hypothetical_protein n=1 Tax=Hexamita inflata TaxID=28002 RepID=A0ABP1GWJ8_9EUKA